MSTHGECNQKSEIKNHKFPGVSAVKSRCFKMKAVAHIGTPDTCEWAVTSRIEARAQWQDACIPIEA